MKRAKSYLAVVVGAFLPVALAAGTIAAAGSGDPHWVDIRKHQLVVSSVFPDCENNLMTIRGFYFEEPGEEILVALDFVPLLVISSDETSIVFGYRVTRVFPLYFDRKFDITGA
jgi:hypothetical protein